MYIKWDMTGIVIGEISEKGDVSLKFCLQHYYGKFQEGIFRKHPKAILDGSESAGAVKVNWWGSSNWSSSQIFLEELTGHYYISIRLYIHRYIYIYLDTYIYIYIYIWLQIRGKMSGPAHRAWSFLDSQHLQHAYYLYGVWIQRLGVLKKSCVRWKSKKSARPLHPIKGSLRLEFKIIID